MQKLKKKIFEIKVFKNNKKKMEKIEKKFLNSLKKNSK